ncbi:hypothetical protein BBJ28_00017989 [Nothophytophthora sp. Chile5]|nr:hypothetical protein BBJ28_00017989 [Nothophytophthora sp. Chile5]
MNEYPPLVSKALELLLQQYNQHDQLLKEMENVQLLVTDETITIYNKLKGDVDDLRRLAETTEVWMDLTSRSDFEKADSVCQLLGSLIKVIQHTKADESSSESPKPRRAHRELSISSPGKAAFGDESDEEDGNSMGDLLGTNPKCAPKHVQLAEGDDHKPTIRFSIEKQPPNRRLVHSRDRYILNPAFGRVSRHSGCHEILPLLSNDRIGFVTEDASAEDGAATEGKTLAVEAQRLLRNLRAAQFVLNMLRDGAHFFEGHFEVERPEPAHAPSSPTTRSRTKLQTRQRDQIRAVFTQGMQFLCAFCMGDAENQALVAPHATMIAQYAGELAISQELLVAIYTDNFPLYRAIPTELINIFVDRLVNDDPNPRYLLFLETLVICNERPVIENQLLVLFQLVKSLENSKVLQAFDEAARTIELLGELFQRHAQCLSDGSEGDKRPELEIAASATRAITLLPILLMSTNTTSESHSPTTADCHNGASIAELLEYHVRLLHLFAACATGKNTRVQEICQQILPLLNVVDLLRHANCTEGVQLALLRYLDQVFLTADEVETPGIDDLVQILMVLSEVCETRVIQFLRLTQVKDVNRLATLSLRKNKTKFGKRLGLSAQSPAESAPLYLVLFSAIPTLFSFLQQFPRLDELNQMVQGILGIEASLKDEYDPQAHLSNVRLSFDLVVSKLVAHVEALQDPSYLKTNLTLLNVFCRMIYAVEDPEECHNMQIKLNQLGVTRLVVQLIASRDNDALFASSIQVGVALLDGMNAEVQESFCNHWREANNALFFERIQARIEKACKLIRNVDRVDLNTTSHSHGDGDVDDAFISSVELGVNDGGKLRHRHSIFDLGLETPSSSTPKAGEKRGAKRLGASVTSIFRFLQLLCEGHYLNAQRALIAQPHAAKSTNLVETTTSFLLDTYLALADLDMGLITQLFETITECCQGPCMEAQETVTNYKFISAVNALLTHSFEQRDVQAQLAARQLRASIVITLLSLLEGRSDYVLHIQLVQELNFEALKMNLVEVYSHFLRKHGVYAGNSKCSEDFYLTMGFNIYILLQQLADRHPQQAWWIPPSKIDKFEVSLSSPTPQESTRGKIYSVSAATDGVAPDYHDAYYFFQSNCAKVEVVWDHHRSPAASNPGRGLSAGGKTDGVSFIGDAVGGSGLFSDPVPTGASTLIPFYFPLHPICFCLTEQSKKKLVWVVSRGVDKLSDFYARSDKLVDEMTHQSHLQHHRHISWLAKKLDRLKRVSFAVAVGINLIVLLFYRAGGIDSRPYAASQVTFIHAWGAIAEPPSPSLWIDYGLSLVGTIQIVLYCVMLVCYMLNSAPLLIKKGWKRRHQVERARRSKRTVHSAQLRSTESKERESFRDTERLLRSLRERENEYDYLFLPPPFRKVSATRRVLNTTSAPASKTDSTKTRASSSTGDKLEGTPSPRRRLRLQLETVGVSLFFLIRNPRVLYSLWQIVIAILGSYVNKLYFAFLLLDVVDRYKELNNVLRSVVRPAKALGMTTLLYLIVVYVFAVVGFFFFREDYTPSSTLTEDQREGRAPYTCQRLFQCFLVSLDQGLKSDGGLGSFLREIPLGTNAHSYGRLAFDVLFNILLVVLLLNLVFGVIIDTFASLRTDDQEKTLDMKSRCFICSIDAYSFDRATKRGFHDHVSRDHNMWHYLYLFVHIRKKRITDYNGLELFLAMRMAKKDVSFFPTHRALSLETRGTLGELLEADVGLEDDRFFAGNSHYGSRRSALDHAENLQL